MWNGFDLKYFSSMLELILKPRDPELSMVISAHEGIEQTLVMSAGFIQNKRIPTREMTKSLVNNFVVLANHVETNPHYAHDKYYILPHIWNIQSKLTEWLR